MDTLGAMVFVIVIVNAARFSRRYRSAPVDALHGLGRPDGGRGAETLLLPCLVRLGSDGATLVIGQRTARRFFMPTFSMPLAARENSAGGADLYRVW